MSPITEKAREQIKSKKEYMDEVSELCSRLNECDKVGKGVLFTSTDIDIIRDALIAYGEQLRQEVELREKALNCGSED